MDHMHHFQQGLRLNIKKYLVISRMQTVEIIDAARAIEQVTNKKKEDSVVNT